MKRARGLSRHLDAFEVAEDVEPASAALEHPVERIAEELAQAARQGSAVRNRLVPSEDVVELLQSALAAHVETIHGLGHGDVLMFAVGGNLVQVIGSEHTIRECTMLRLADLKGKAEAGDRQARRWYYELTAGRGVLQRFERGADGRETVKMKFPSEPGWFAEVEPGLKRVSVAGDVDQGEGI